jgi:hypothetical protein
MQTAIAGLRARLGPDRPIFVVHVDQAANDFNTLFDVLHRDPERYALHDPNVFPSAMGRSFYGNVFPPEHVHLGWSSYAVIWLSRTPTLIPDHFVAYHSTSEVRAAFERQGTEDWKSFLSLRARELQPGGRLVVVLPGMDDHGSTGFEHLFDRANEALAEMVEEGAIAPSDRARMVLAGCPRSRRDLLAPFEQDGQFRGLTVEQCDLALLPDPAWTDYENGGNTDLLATRQAQFFRSAFAPSLACALTGATDPTVCCAFADRLEDRLKRRLVDRPGPLHSFVQTIVLAKQGPGSAVRSN